MAIARADIIEKFRAMIALGEPIVGMAEERLVLVLVFHSPSMPLIRGNSHSPRGLSGLRRVGYCSRAR